MEPLNPFFNGARSKTSVNHKNGLRKTTISGITMEDLTTFDQQRQAKIFDEMLKAFIPDIETSLYSVSMMYPGMTKPFYMSLRSHELNSGIAIVKKLEILMQSNEGIKPDQNLTFELIVIEKALSRRQPQLESQAVGKRGNGQKGTRIPYVCNLFDTLCLPRAAAVAFAYGGMMALRRDSHITCEKQIPASIKSLYNKRKNQFHWLTNQKEPKTDERQKGEALHILAKCGIPANKESYGIEDLKTIYERFKPFSEFDNLPYPPFSFHVFSFDGIWKCSIEDENHKADQYPLLFLHYDCHMDFAKDLLHKEKVFCHLCGLVYKENRHHYCKKRCFLCYNKAGKCQPVAGEGRVCEECNFFFENAECFAAHQRPLAAASRNPEATMCTQRHLCVKEGGCGKAYHVDSTRSHNCEERFCSRCGTRRPENHFCHWKDVSPTERKDMAARCKKFKTCLLDFETMANSVNDKDEVELFPNGHVPIWVGAVNACEQCQHTEIDPDGTNVCDNCGGERVFERIYDPKDPVKGKKDYVITEFVNHIFCSGRFDGFTCMAHNLSGFDHVFILQKLLSMGVTPKVLTQGTRVLWMKVDRNCFSEDRALEIAKKEGKTEAPNPINGTVVLKCSWLFTQSPLSEFSKTFNLEEEKSEFPYSLVSDKYWYYDSPTLPDKKWYEPGLKKPRAFKEFNEWYEENKNKPFNLIKELRRYAWLDVVLLLKGVIRLRQIYVEHCKFDPFQECVTLAATAQMAFRLNHLEHPELIAHIDERGQPLSENQSMLAFRYLLWYEKDRNEKRKKMSLPPGRMQTALSEEKEKVLDLKDGKKYRIDGWWEEDGKGYGIEIQGCYFHSCPSCASRLTKPKDIADAESRLHNTRYKMELLRQAGYEIEEVWEHEITAKLEESDSMKKFFEEFSHLERLFPRQAYAGGKTYTSKLIAQCPEGVELGFGDFSSLYPACMMFGSFPYGAPTVTKKYRQETKHIPVPPPGYKLEKRGLFLCKVLADKAAKQGVLPYRHNKSLYFANCALCSHLEFDGVCLHSDAEREFIGVWTHEELNACIELGGKITEIYETWTWTEWSKPGELFGDFVKTFYKMKLCNSGWGDRRTPEAKKEFLDGLKEKMGIELKEEDIKENKALRFLSKLLLNSLFGKLGEKVRRSTVEYVSDRDQILDIALNPRIKVTACQWISSTFEDNGVVDDECILMMTYHTRKIFEDCARFSNLVIASFITSYARLELLKVIRAVNDGHVYSDTDSICYYKTPEAVEALRPFTHPYLGGIESEIRDDFKMIEMIAPSAKCYAFRQVRRDNPLIVIDTMKIRGVNLTQSAQESLCFDKFREHVENYVIAVAKEKLVDLENGSLEERKRKKPVTTEGLPVHEFKQRHFRRLHHRILTEKNVKKLRIHQHKGVLEIETTRVYPFGYVPPSLQEGPVSKMAKIDGTGIYDSLTIEFM